MPYFDLTSKSLHVVKRECPYERPVRAPPLRGGYYEGHEPFGQSPCCPTVLAVGVGVAGVGEFPDGAHTFKTVPFFTGTGVALAAVGLTFAMLLLR
jgi:hypothetical protein